MDTTSASLLMRLSAVHVSPNERSMAWSQFVSLYTPLVFYWARKTGLQSQDAADLVQEVMTIVFQKLPEFRYEPDKSFRGWLRKVTLNKYRQILRKKKLNVVEASNSFLEKLPDQNRAESLAAATWDQEYAKELVAQATELLKDDFAPKTWSALKLLLTTDRPVGEIAAETDVSIWTIYSARSRLLGRLRRELDGLLD